MSDQNQKALNYFNRLYATAYFNTPFGRELKKRTAAGLRPRFTTEKHLMMDDGAEDFYRYTGCVLFRREVRELDEISEYSKQLSALERLSLPSMPLLIIQKLPESIDRALIAVEEKCRRDSRIERIAREFKHLTYSRKYDSYFRSGAWQLYYEVRKLIPELLQEKRDRNTLEIEYLLRDSVFPVNMEPLLEKDVQEAWQKTLKLIRKHQKNKANRKSD